MHPNLGGQDGVVAVSLVLSRPVPRSQSELSAGWRRGEWVHVRNPYRVKNYTYSRVLGHVHSYSSVTSSRVVNPAFYLPLVHFPLWSQLRCREREFLHRPGMGEIYDYGYMWIYVLVLA